MRFCESPNCNDPVWGTCKITRKGYCKRHQSLRKDFNRKSIIQRAIEKKSKVRTLHQVVKNTMSPEDLKYIQELELFFDRAAKVIDEDPKCWECGKFIPKKYYRAATAHILPKKIFKSIATNDLSYLILGAGCGCHGKTHRLDTFSKMKIFKEAVDRFNQIKHLITERNDLLNQFEELAAKHLPPCED